MRLRALTLLMGWSDFLFTTRSSSSGSGWSATAFCCTKPNPNASVQLQTAIRFAPYTTEAVQRRRDQLLSRTCGPGNQGGPKVSRDAPGLRENLQPVVLWPT